MKKTTQHSPIILFLFFLLPWSGAQTVFTERALDAGIDHFFLSYDVMGGGVAIFDYDNDGWEDIWINGGNNRDVLYKNMGDGIFTEVGFQAGLLITLSIHTKGIVTGDINNDGWRDVFLPTRGESANLLLLNNGDGTFVNIASFAGMADDKAWSTSATMADMNNDGWLDIYVGNYVEDFGFLVDDQTNEIIGYDHTCQPNFLYLNNGDLTFSQIALLSGTDDEGCALAVAFSDFNLDGKSDIIVANDFGEWVLPNASFQNSDDHFTNESSNNGMDIGIYAMGIAVGDVDQDRDLDYYFTNLGRNVLLENDGGYFNDISESAGVENTYAGNFLTVGWGTAFFDVDNDSDLDLFVANGFITALNFNQTSVQNPDKLFLNNAWPAGNPNTFSDFSNQAGVGDTGLARGFAHADFDKDGDQDFVVVRASGTSDPNVAQKVLFYRNDLTDQSNWLEVDLEGVLSNRDAYGAKMEIQAGGKSWIHEVVGGGSHASQHSSIAHFGLGESATVDSLIIFWPSGKRQALANIPANQILQIQEDTATITNSYELPMKTGLNLRAMPNPFRSRTQVQFSNPESKKLLLTLLDLTGNTRNTWETTAEQVEINSNKLSPGIYFLKIQSGEHLINVLKLSVVP